MSTAEIATLTKQYSILSHKVANLEQGVSNSQKSLHRIEQGLFGDEDLSHTGAIKQLKEIRLLFKDINERVEFIRVEKQNEDALSKNNKYWLSGIASAIGGGVVWVMNLIFK